MLGDQIVLGSLDSSFRARMIKATIARTPDTPGPPISTPPLNLTALDQSSPLSLTDSPPSSAAPGPASPEMSASRAIIPSTQPTREDQPIERNHRRQPRPHQPRSRLNMRPWRTHRRRTAHSRPGARHPRHQLHRRRRRMLGCNMNGLHAHDGAGKPDAGSRETALSIQCPECGYQYPPGTHSSPAGILDPIVEIGGHSTHPAHCSRSESPLRTDGGATGYFQQMPSTWRQD